MGSKGKDTWGPSFGFREHPVAAGSQERFLSRE